MVIRLITLMTAHADASLVHEPHVIKSMQVVACSPRVLPRHVGPSHGADPASMHAIQHVSKAFAERAEIAISKLTSTAACLPHHAGLCNVLGLCQVQPCTGFLCWNHRRCVVVSMRVRCQSSGLSSRVFVVKKLQLHTPTTHPFMTADCEALRRYRLSISNAFDQRVANYLVLVLSNKRISNCFAG